jgi:ankyrin repeat protein
MIFENLSPRAARNGNWGKALAWTAVIVLAALVWRGPDLIDWYAGAPRGNDLLFCAAGDGTAEDIDRALSQGAQINARSVSELTPLFVAAGARHAVGVRALLDRGADPNAIADTGLTPLYSAVVSDDPAVIEMLLGAGANANFVNRGETALDAAIRMEHPSSERVLRKHGARRANLEAESLTRSGERRQRHRLQEMTRAVDARNPRSCAPPLNGADAPLPS